MIDINEQESSPALIEKKKVSKKNITTLCLFSYFTTVDSFKESEVELEGDISDMDDN